MDWRRWISFFCQLSWLVFQMKHQISTMPFQSCSPSKVSWKCYKDFINSWKAMYNFWSVFILFCPESVGLNLHMIWHVVRWKVDCFWWHGALYIVPSQCAKPLASMGNRPHPWWQTTWPSTFIVPTVIRLAAHPAENHMDLKILLVKLRLV